MLKKFYLLLFTLAFFCPNVSFSQNNFPCWAEYIHDRDAVSVAYAQNSLWVSTKNALIRFDPDTKTILERIDAFNARFSIYSGSLASDPNDNLWIGGRGLGKYDGHRFALYDRSNSPLVTPNGFDVGITTIKPDAQGRVWLATNQGGFMFDGNQTWTKYDTATTDIPYLEVLDIQPDAQGNVWFTFGNLYIPKKELAMVDSNGQWTFFSKAKGNFPLETASRLYLDKDNNLWVGGDSGIAKWLGGGNWQIVPFPAQSLHGGTRSFAKGPDDTFFIGTVSGVLRFDGTQLHDDLGFDRYYANSLFWSLCFDKSQHLWAATLNSGLHVWENNSVQVIPLHPHRFNGGPIVDIRASKDGKNVWVGAGYGGLFKFDGQTWTEFDGFRFPLVDSWIGTFEMGDKGDFWFSVSSYFELKVYYSPDGTSFNLLRSYGTFAGSLVLRKILATPHGLYMHINDKLLLLDSIGETTIPTPVALDGQTKLEKDPNGNLWLSTAKNGVWLYDGNDWREVLPGMSTENLRFMAISQTGTVWALDDPKQLLRYENGDWHVFDASHLPVASFSGVLPDGRGGVFVAGYLSSSSSTGVIYHFDGIIWKEIVQIKNVPQPWFNNVQPFRLIGDNLWFGSNIGVLIYDLACAGILSSVKTEPAAFAPVQVQPNPSGGWAKISWDATTGPTTAKKLVLYDLLGKTALSQSISAKATELSLDLSALPQGSYHGVLMDENQRVLSRFKVVRQSP